MTKGLFLAVVLSLGLVGAAFAAPTMTGKGPMSLTFEANPDSPLILFGWNIAEMTKFNIGAGVINTEPYEVSDSNTSWQFQTGINRYVGSISNNMFAPYIGAQVNLWDNGTEYDTSYSVRGYFGVEAFVVESLSFGGNIGMKYTQEGDYTGTSPGYTPDYKSTFGTGSSAILATLYW